MGTQQKGNTQELYKYRKKKNKSFEDGDLFHEAFNVDNLIKKDRMKLAIPILNALGAKKDDIVTLSRVVGNPHALFLSIISQDMLENLDRIEIDQEQIDSFIRELIDENPGWSDTRKSMVEGIHLMMKVKSQMRIGTKTEIKKMMETLGACSGDYIALQYCEDPVGWYVLLIKQESIPRVYVPFGGDGVVDSGDSGVKE